MQSQQNEFMNEKDDIESEFKKLSAQINSLQDQKKSLKLELKNGCQRYSLRKENSEIKKIEQGQIRQLNKT